MTQDSEGKYIISKEEQEELINKYKDKSLQDLNSQLASEWHPTKNGDLKPNMLTCGSNKKVWWLYSYDDPNTGKHFDFEWPAKIYNRNRGDNCPFLSPHPKVWPGFNDLETINPQLATEWNYDKNYPLTPQDFTCCSKQKVWWLLPYDDPNTGKHFDFEWPAIISDRHKGNNCPYLSGQDVWAGFNDLKSNYPRIAQEWDYEKNYPLTPETIPYGSGKNVYWKCSKGHSWKNYINNRTSHHENCPECQKGSQTSYPEYVLYYYIKKIYNDVIHTYKDLGFEIDIYIPSLKVGIEYDGGNWHNNVTNDLNKDKLCEKENITLYRIKEPNCKKLNSSSIEIFMKKNNKKELENSIYKLFEYLNIQNIDINLTRDDIDIINSMNLSYVENSIEKTHPYLIKEWDFEKNKDLIPAMFTSGSGQYIHWKCPICDNQWYVPIYSRTKGNGCSVCSGKSIKTGINDFATKYPNLSLDWDFNLNIENPYTLSCSNKNKFNWICHKCNHKWQQSLVNRINSPQCPNCKKNSTSKTWMDWYILIEEYLKTNNKITKNTIYKNKKIGNWIKNQKNNYKKNKLNEEQIELLKKIYIL